MSPRGYVAITPDGTIVERAVVPQVRIELLRVAASIGVAAVLGVFLYFPAMLWSAVAKSIRPLAGPAEAGHYEAQRPAEAGRYEAQRPLEAGRYEAQRPAEAGRYGDVVSAFRRTGERRR